MKFYLCDDEEAVHALYKEKIAAICEKHQLECEIVSFYNGEAMLFEFDKQDGFSGIVFLDINMPRVNGITVAKRLLDYKLRGQLIFLTKSNRHFLLAFDVQAFNYIIKDTTSDARFEDVLLRAVEESAHSEDEYMLFACGGDNISVPIKDIHYFEVLRRRVTVHYEGGTFEFVSSMARVENQLLGKGFIRTHRAYFVSLRYIQSLVFGELTLRDGTTLPIGRTYYPEVKETFYDFSKVFG